MTDLAAALIAGWFGQADGELLVGGVPISRIVAEHGTPLFVYDASVLERKWNLLRDALPAACAARPTTSIASAALPSANSVGNG